MARIPAEKSDSVNVLAQLGLTEIARTSDSSTLPYGALAPIAKLPRGARATAMLLVMKEKPAFREWCLAGSGFGDEHVPKLIEVLHGSECAISLLDLGFNPRFTDAGLLQLSDTLGREGLAGHDLTTLRLGACAALSESARNTAVALFAKKRPDLTIDFTPTISVVEGSDGRGPHNVMALLQVGKVFPNSPASAAGLVKGDEIVQLGSMTFCGKERNRGFKSEFERHTDAICHFLGVAESLKPLVQEQAAISGTIDIIVQRGYSTFLPLQLQPGAWEGEGLLGAKMGLPAA